MDFTEYSYSVNSNSVSQIIISPDIFPVERFRHIMYLDSAARLETAGHQIFWPEIVQEILIQYRYLLHYLKFSRIKKYRNKQNLPISQDLMINSVTSKFMQKSLRKKLCKPNFFDSTP
jgi:hypothetical protein